jgi:hypothetical protein
MVWTHFDFGLWNFNGGLYSTNDWSVKRGEERQRELIGMTAEMEAPSEGMASRVGE